MTVTPTKESLLNLVGLNWKIDAYVVGFAFLDGGILAAALGDGRVAFYNAEDINAARVEDDQIGNDAPVDLHHARRVDVDLRRHVWSVDLGVSKRDGRLEVG